MAGAAGAMVSTSYAFNPDIGQTFILKTFAAITLGGMGSFVGGLVGALLLGLAESLAAWYMTAQIAEMVAYVVLVAVLAHPADRAYGDHEEMTQRAVQAMLAATVLFFAAVSAFRGRLQSLVLPPACSCI